MLFSYLFESSVFVCAYTFDLYERYVLFYVYPLSLYTKCIYTVTVWWFLVVLFCWWTHFMLFIHRFCSQQNARSICKWNVFRAGCTITDLIVFVAALRSMSRQCTYIVWPYTHIEGITVFFCSDEPTHILSETAHRLILFLFLVGGGAPNIHIYYTCCVRKFQYNSFKISSSYIHIWFPIWYTYISNANIHYRYPHKYTKFKMQTRALESFRKHISVSY